MKKIILCIPLSERKMPPTDQKNCIPHECPFCKELMWVSEGKRNFIRNHKDTILICMICIVKAQIKNRVKLEDVQFIDINNFH